MRSTVAAPRPAPQAGALRPLQGGAPPGAHHPLSRALSSSVSPDWVGGALPGCGPPCSLPTAACPAPGLGLGLRTPLLAPQGTTGPHGHVRGKHRAAGGHPGPCRRAARPPCQVQGGAPPGPGSQGHRCAAWAAPQGVRSGPRRGGVPPAEASCPREGRAQAPGRCVFGACGNARRAAGDVP